MKALLTLAVLLFGLPLSAATFTSNGPHTTNNDDSCDISLLPAATLLIPYFDVDVTSALGSGETTLITITNTSRLPVATAVTLWTDFGYPVITFPVYLTGYDVQSINLYDVIRRGRIAPDAGTGSDVSPVGELSGTSPNDDFDNPQLDESTCRNLPVQVPQVYITRMTEAFTHGTFPQVGSVPGCELIGGTHEHAVGYATIDVVTACDASLPIQPAYFSAVIGYDNVLMGDYAQVDGANDSAQGSPAVHIRAIPEGGSPATRKPNNFKRTFYSHLQPAASRTLDNRQPLPSTFGARWIEGGVAGFQTSYKIWREVDTAPNSTCASYGQNQLLSVTEIVRFDEEENPETIVSTPIIDPPLPSQVIPAAALVPTTASEIIPLNTSGAVAGWLYLNLNNSSDEDVASQNWVVTSMRAENRFSVDSDATALGNGCSAPTPASNATVTNGPPIGPAPNTTP